MNASTDIFLPRMLLSLAILALLALVQTQAIPAAHPVSGNLTPPYPQTVDPSDWLTYHDPEIGIEFSYPRNAQLEISSEIRNLDIGTKREISVIAAGNN